MPRNVDAVLFDLDGTLADTAPDLASALNALRAADGLPPVDPVTLRPYTSQGVRGMLWAGCGIAKDDLRYPDQHRRYLDHYRRHLCRESALFEGIGAVLQYCAARRIPWGVVTNKTQSFTIPLLAALDVLKAAACVVSGDSSPAPKPSPAPLLLAAALTRTPPARCLYVGDDERDIQAGRRAGMTTVAVRYGYIAPDTSADAWNASYVIDRPESLLPLIDADGA